MLVRLEIGKRSSVDYEIEFILKVLGKTLTDLGCIGSPTSAAAQGCIKVVRSRRKRGIGIASESEFVLNGDFAYLSSSAII